MQNNVNKYVHASQISSYYMCPRLVYFQMRRAHDTTEASVRAGFFKALSLTLTPVVLSPQPTEAMGEAIKCACTDTLAIYGIPHEQTIIAAGQEARALAEKIIAGLDQERERSGEEELMSVLSPSFVSITAYSDKLRLSGTIDKVIICGGVPVPVIVSASDAPASGVYASDRIRMAAYAMLLGEKYGVDCARGAVEYVPGWSLRRAEIRYEDKRKALYARNRILEMGQGRMPDAKTGKWCGACGHEDACRVRPTLLSSIFK